MEDLLRKASEVATKEFEGQGLEPKPLVLVVPNEEESEAECPTSAFFLSDGSVWVLRLQPVPAVGLTIAQVACRLHLPAEAISLAELEPLLASSERRSFAKMWIVASPFETMHVVELSLFVHASSHADLVAHLRSTLPGLTRLLRAACSGLLTKLGDVARRR